MNVDRSALSALALFGLLGLGFAVVALGLNREPKTMPAKKEEPTNGPELLPLPRELSTASRSIHVAYYSPFLSIGAVEKAVANYLEPFLQVPDGIVSIYTRVQPGECRCELRLLPGCDEHQLRTKIENQVKECQKFLPEVAQIQADARTPDALPVFWIAARDDGTHTEVELSDVLRLEVRNSLSIPGIRDIEIRGDRQLQLTLHVEPEKLQAHNLRLRDVINAVSTADVALDEEGIKKLEGAVLAKPILIRDVGTVVKGTRRNGFARFNGRRVVLAGIHLAAGANKQAVGAAVRSRLREAAIPEGITLEVVADATRLPDESVLVECRFPAGTTPDQLEDRTNDIERALREQLGQRELGEFLTVGPKPGEAEPTVQTLASRKIGHSLNRDEIQTRIREIAGNFPDVRVRTSAPESGSTLRSAALPIRLAIVGDDFDLLRNWTAEILRVANQDGTGLIDASSGSLTISSEMQIKIDRTRAAALGMSVREMLEAIETRTGIARHDSSSPDGTFSAAVVTGARSVVVRGGSIAISYPDDPNQRPEDIGLLPFTTKDGKKVLLKELSKLERIESPALIERWNGHRCATIVANPAPGTESDVAGAKLRKIAEEVRQKLKLPASCQIVGQ